MKLYLYIFEFIDYYLKGIIPKDLNIYKKALYGKRQFTDFYYKKYKIKDDIEKGKYESIIISVEFLATTKTNFVTKHNIVNYHKTKIWTHGLRGSNCQSPGNPDWINQVTQMYNYLKINR